MDASAVFAEMNAARAAPAAYAKHLAPMAAAFKGTLMSLPGRTPLRTKEGKKAVDEAVEFLKAAKPVPPLVQLSPGLTAAAADMVAAAGPEGIFGHTVRAACAPAARRRTRRR